jgi:hypothetical protein
MTHERIGRAVPSVGMEHSTFADLSHHMFFGLVTVTSTHLLGDALSTICTSPWRRTRRPVDNVRQELASAQERADCDDGRS